MKDAPDRPALDGSEVVDRALTRLGERRSWRDVRHAYTDLDALLGPLLPGQVVTVDGARGSGRSIFALDLCRAVGFRQGRNILLVTGRSTAAEVGIRILSAEARISVAALRTGELHQHDEIRLAEGQSRLRDGGLYLLEVPSDLSAMQRLVYEAWVRHDIDVVVIDDVDAIPAGSHTSSLFSLLRDLARKLLVPVVATGVDSVVAPEPSGGLDARVSIAIDRPDLLGESATPGEVFLTVRRPDVDAVTLSFSFQGHYSRFTDLGRARS